MVYDFINKNIALGISKEPFFFVIDFDLDEFIVKKLIECEVLFKIDNFTNFPIFKKTNKNIFLDKFPISLEEYKVAFDRVKEEIKSGNTYLLNLTFQTQLNANLDLEEIFYATEAKFKIYVKDRFVCFSPERFIQIKNNKIQTHPMKGTIDASVPNAAKTILNDEKEMSEHLMVVDLLRNDLSMVSKKVRVERYRYIDKIKAGEKELLQVSSKIVGDLEEKWQSRIGNILTSLLPAGSITGTPKRMTTKIIKKIENYKRGFYTGIFGFFDGENLDSSVMIRFIEKTENGYVYKSGGGITLLSDADKEYEEMCEKIYVPLY